MYISWTVNNNTVNLTCQAFKTKQAVLEYKNVICYENTNRYDFKYTVRNRYAKDSERKLRFLKVEPIDLVIGCFVIDYSRLRHTNLADDDPDHKTTASLLEFRQLLHDRPWILNDLMCVVSC